MSKKEKKVEVVEPRVMENHALKPESASVAVKTQEATKGDVVTVVSPSGKEVVIATKMLSNHLDRGFTVKKD
jgi:translation initiation factor 1 (eIF-1/SUI1)